MKKTGLGINANDPIFKRFNPSDSDYKEGDGGTRFQNKTTKYLQSFKFRGVK